MNEHYYCKDPETGIIYRATGYTYKDELIVYPKYLPDYNGDRSKGPLKYRGINYPTQSIKLLESTTNWQSKNVSLKLDSQFNCFIPKAKKQNVEIYKSKDAMQNLYQSLMPNKLQSKAMKLIDLICKETTTLSRNDFGIDGSILTEMDRPSSDIDLIVYGHDKALEARKLVAQLINAGKIENPLDQQDFFVNRRMIYSPLMTTEEILLWETRKISSIFTGTKFSIMPKNLKMVDEHTYSHTNQYIAIRFKVNEGMVVYDPGVIDLKKCSVLETVWGPKGLDFTKVISLLPSRMGVFLKEGDHLFAVGQIYRNLNSNDFILAQMPWDDISLEYETKFVTKIEITKLDSLLPNLLIDLNQH